MSFAGLLSGDLFPFASYLIIAMNRKHLSLEADGILSKAKDISPFLQLDLERLIEESTSEGEYLEKVHALIKEVVEDQNGYVEDWLLEERFDERRLFELLQYIRSVRHMPPSVKLYDTNYKRVLTR